MGWDIELIKNGEIVSVAGHQAGSNQLAEMQDGELIAVDRSEAYCCITYNYSEAYKLVNFSMSNMNGLTGGETVDELHRAIEKLGTKKYDKDYWAPTPGNAGYALSILLSWATEHPDAVWHIC